MLDGLLQYLSERSVPELARDVLDVAIVYYILYRALLVLRGTRAIQVGIGLAFIFLLYVFAQHFQLLTVSSVLGALIPGAAILIVVVVFQNDIRRALMRMGSQPWFGVSKAHESRAIDEVVDAATELARHRTGAIVAFEQDANLDEFVGANKGTPLDAAVTKELLVTLFVPEAMNKLHDGAVIIRDLRVAKAGVFFPMPDTRVLDPSFGSRHRAALGITEETDAVVVVVSEERGSISFCFNGNIVGNLDGPGLRRALEGVFASKPGKKQKRKRPAPRRETPPPAAAESPALTAAAPKAIEEPPLPASTEPTPAPRVRTTEPSDADLRAESEAPPPLRKAKAPDKTKPPEKVEAETTGGGRMSRGPRAPLTTPMRSQSDGGSGGGESRPMPRAGATDTSKSKRSPEESVPDSSEHGEPS